MVGKGWRDAGISMELVESSSKKKILDGWSLDVYGSRKRGGLGIAKNILKKDLIEVDVGVYVTKRLKDLLDFKVKPNVSVGLSGKWRF